MFSTNPQTAIEVDVIAVILEAMPYGSTLPYDAMSKKIGRDVRKDARMSVLKARRRAERNTKSLYATVRGIGVQRLLSQSIAGLGKDVRAKIGRKARSTYERLSSAKYNDIDTRQQAQIDAERSLLGAIAAMSTVTASNRVSEHTSTGPVVMTKVLEILG